MPLDDADKAAIAKMVSDALTANNETLGKQFVTADQATKMVEQNLANGLKAAGLDKVGDTLAGLSTKLEELGKGGKEGGGKEGGEGGKTDPAVARLQEELDKVKAQSRQSEEAREAAEARARTSQLHNQIRAGLTALNIPADRHDLVIPVLERMTATDGKPVLRFKDDGTPVWVAQRKGYVDELDIAKGIAEWGQGEQAKVYLPPKGGTGTGTGAGAGDDDARDPSLPRDASGGLSWGALGDQVEVDLSQTVG